MKKRTILAFFFPCLGYKKISYFTTEFHDYDLEMIRGQRIGALGEKMHAAKGLLVLFYNRLIPSLAAITLYFLLQREEQFKMGFWAAKWLATRQVKWFLFPKSINSLHNLKLPSTESVTTTELYVMCYTGWTWLLKAMWIHLVGFQGSIVFFQDVFTKTYTPQFTSGSTAFMVSIIYPSSPTQFTF